MDIDYLKELFYDYDIYQCGDSILIRMFNRLCIEYRGSIYAGIVEFDLAKNKLIDPERNNLEYKLIYSSNRSLEPLDR